MRVVHVIPGLDTGGGAEESMAMMAPFLTAAGVEQHVVLLHDRRDLVPRIEADGAITHDLSGARGLRRRSAALRSLIRRLRPAVVHSTLFEADLAVAMAASGLRIPRLVTWATTPYAVDRLAEPGLDRRKLQAVRALETVMGRWGSPSFQAVTPGVARENSRALRIDPRRVHIVGRGRPDVGPPSAGTRASVRAGLGVGESAPLVLCVSRHEPRKGLDLLIEEFGDWSGRRCDAVLAIAGRAGGWTPELQSLADRRAPGRVRLLGHRDDVPDLMAAADLVVSASRTEGAAGSLIEAMAAGVPIVATRVAGLDGVLVDGDNARVVDRGPGSLAAAMAAVVDDSGLAERLAGGARRTYEERFTLERAAEDLANLYRDLAGAGDGVRRSRRAG